MRKTILDASLFSDILQKWSFHNIQKFYSNARSHGINWHRKPIWKFLKHFIHISHPLSFLVQQTCWFEFERWWHNTRFVTVAVLLTGYQLWWLNLRITMTTDLIFWHRIASDHPPSASSSQQAILSFFHPVRRTYNTTQGPFCQWQCLKVII